MIYLYFHSDALANKGLLENLQHNFTVAGPVSLEFVDKTEDPVALARQLYLHYLGTTHATEARVEDLMRVSRNISKKDLLLLATAEIE